MMNSLIRTMAPLGPVSLVSQSQSLFDLFDEIFSDTSRKDICRTVEEYPVPINIYSHKQSGAGKIVVALPGFTEKEIKVIAEDGSILVEAKHQEEDKDANAEWEKISGRIKSKEFVHRITRLPRRWDLSDAKIKFEHGELEITIPVKEEMKRKELVF